MLTHAVFATFLENSLTVSINKGSPKYSVTNPSGRMLFKKKRKKEKEKQTNKNKKTNQTQELSLLTNNNIYGMLTIPFQLKQSLIIVYHLKFPEFDIKV